MNSEERKDSISTSESRFYKISNAIDKLDSIRYGVPQIELLAFLLVPEKYSRYQEKIESQLRKIVGYALDGDWYSVLGGPPSKLTDIGKDEWVVAPAESLVRVSQLSSCGDLSRVVAGPEFFNQFHDEWQLRTHVLVLDGNNNVFEMTQPPLFQRRYYR